MDDSLQSDAAWAADIFRGSLVRLTAPRPDDAEILARWSEDAGYRRRMDTDAARPLPPQHFQDRDEEPEPGAFEFRVRTLQDERLVGFTAVFGIEWPNRHGWFSMGIGDPADRGHGYGEEALRLTLRFAFHELGLHRVSLDVIAPNRPALELYRKVGFQEEGRLRERLLRGGGAFDLLYMGLLAREWESKSAPARAEPG
ncbi:MAG: GNAT family protein [Candidatus Dormiibacterota bacterium]